jgi:hypothetical protein
MLHQQSNPRVSLFFDSYSCCFGQIISLLNLGTATSGRIKRFIDNKIDKELKSAIEKDENDSYENGEFSRSRRDQNIKKRIDRLRMSQRTIQSWLNKLEAEGLIEKNTNFEYSLTLKILGTDIMFELMGQAAFSSVANLPLPDNTNLEQQFDEISKRIGTYVMFIFITNSMPKEIRPPLPDSLIDIDEAQIKRLNIRMIRNAINPVFMYQKMFCDRFMKCKEDGDYNNNKPYEIEKKTFDQLMVLFRKKYPEILDAILAGGEAFHKRIHVPYHNEKVEALKAKFPFLEKNLQELVGSPTD